MPTKKQHPQLALLLVALLAGAALSVMIYGKDLAPGTHSASLTAETYDDELLRNVAFDFPDTWNVYTTSSVVTSGVSTIALSPETMGACLECGGYFGKEAVVVSLINYPLYDASRKADYPTNLEEAEALLTRNGIATIVSRNTQEMTNGTLTTLVPREAAECDAPGGCRVPVEQLVFVPKKGNLVVLVTLTGREDSQEVRAGWEMIKSSFDFSKF